MPFHLTPDQREIQMAVRRWAEAELAPRAYERDREGKFPAALYTKCQQDLALNGLAMPQSVGGAGLGILECCLALDELARCDQSFALTCQAGIGVGGMLYQYTSAAIRERYLTDHMEGRIIGAGAITEPQAGTWTAGMTTRAVAVDDGWRITGEKAFITNAGTELTAYIFVATVTSPPHEPKQFSLFLVPADAPGLEVGKSYDKLGWRSCDTHPVYFDNVHVGPEALVGKLGEGRRIMHDGIKPGRILISALAVGVAQGCLDHAVKYAQERVSFGKPLGALQLIQGKIADMAVNVEVARAFMLKTAWEHDNGLGNEYTQSVCKYFCTEMASKVADDAIQVHGGFGFMNECFASRALRDTRVLRIGEGTSELQALMVAKALGLPVNFT